MTHAAVVPSRASQPSVPPLRSVPPSSLLIRPIAPSDAEELQHAFMELSATSRYYRFHTTYSQLPAALLRLLTEVDGVNHVALVAIERQPNGARHGVGVGRFVRSESDPQCAELALTVIDRLQGRGIGRRLIRELAQRARELGIARFRVVVLAANYRVRSLLARLGAVSEGSGAGGVLGFSVPVQALL
jgi:RimJ/RimL family protein N-acetyltransferase